MTDERYRPEPVDVSKFEGHTPGAWKFEWLKRILMDSGDFENDEDPDILVMSESPDILADLVATRRERDAARAEVERLRVSVVDQYHIGYMDAVSAFDRFADAEKPCLRSYVEYLMALVVEKTKAALDAGKGKP